VVVGGHQWGDPLGNDFSFGGLEEILTRTRTWRWGGGGGGSIAGERLTKGLPPEQSTQPQRCGCSSS